MAKIESMRVLPVRRESHGGGGYGARPSSDLLELLEAGEPAAFATDSRHRIVFWNSGASRVFGRRSEEAMGLHCYEVIGGRDVFGNRFCHASCAVSTMARAEEPLQGFEMRVAPKDGPETSLQVTVLRMPGPRPDLFTLVHMIHPIDERTRQGRVAEAQTTGAGAGPAGAGCGNGRASARGNGHACASGQGPATGAPPLTPRENEILRCVAEGLQNKEIARKLDLSLATVRNHVHNTLEKLGVHSKLEAVSLAFRSGWVEEKETAASESGSAR